MRLTFRGSPAVALARIPSRPSAGPTAVCCTMGGGGLGDGGDGGGGDGGRIVSHRPLGNEAQQLVQPSGTKKDVVLGV